jgi:hypothetical protein
MKTSPAELEWGIREAIPEGATAGLGARCLLDGDLLFDREDRFAVDSDAERRLRLTWNAAMVERVRRAYDRVRGASALVMLIETKGVCVVARARAGYVHVAMWLKDRPGP